MVTQRSPGAQTETSVFTSFRMHIIKRLGDVDTPVVSRWLTWISSRAALRWVLAPIMTYPGNCDRLDMGIGQMRGE